MEFNSGFKGLIVAFKRYSKLVPLQAMKEYLGKDVRIVPLILEISAR